MKSRPSKRKSLFITAGVVLLTLAIAISTNGTPTPDATHTHLVLAPRTHKPYYTAAIDRAGTIICLLGAVGSFVVAMRLK